MSGQDALLPGREVGGRVSCGTSSAQLLAYPELKSLKLSTDDGRCQRYTSRAARAASHRIEIAVPYLGTVNVWLLEGDPLTLVDTGPANAESLEALEAALDALGTRLEDDRARAAHAPPPRSLRSRRARSRRAPAPGSPRRRARRRGASSYHERAALERAFGRAPPRRARRPAERDRGERAVLGAHRPEQRGLRDDRRPRRRRRRPGRRPRATGSSNVRGTASPTRSSSTTTTASRSSATTCSPEITSGAEVVPLEPSGERAGGARSSQYLDGLRADGGDGARRPAPRSRARDPRPPAADRRATRVPRAPARARRRLDRRRAAARRSRSRSACGTRRPRETQAVLAIWEVDRAPRRPRRARARRGGRRRRRQPSCSDRACAEPHAPTERF